MSDLNTRAWKGVAQFFIATCLLIFVPAGTLHYGHAWIFLAAFFIPVVAITVYLMAKDAKLLERRMGAGPAAEKQARQKIIQFIASLAFISVFVVSSLDHRFAWSVVNPYCVFLGDGLVVLGLFLVYLVFKENTHSSAIVEIDSDQKVISTGPYAVVRHPMYLGAFIMLMGIPLSLGSYVGLIPIVVLMFAILWRLLDEETFLAKNLAGYSDYQQKVRFRLVPHIW